MGLEITNKIGGSLEAGYHCQPPGFPRKEVWMEFIWVIPGIGLVSLIGILYLIIEDERIRRKDK